jgi:hypothetical protein
MNFVNQLEDYLRDLGAEARKKHPGGLSSVLSCWDFPFVWLSLFSRMVSVVVVMMPWSKDTLLFIVSVCSIVTIHNQLTKCPLFVAFFSVVA